MRPQTHLPSISKFCPIIGESPHERKRRPARNGFAARPEESRRRPKGCADPSFQTPDPHGAQPPAEAARRQRTRERRPTRRRVSKSGRQQRGICTTKTLPQAPAESANGFRGQKVPKCMIAGRLDGENRGRGPSQRGAADERSAKALVTCHRPGLRAQLNRAFRDFLSTFQDSAFTAGIPRAERANDAATADSPRAERANDAATETKGKSRGSSFRTLLVGHAHAERPHAG